MRIDTKAIRQRAASRKARQNIACQQDRMVISEERKRRHERAQNTPYFDKMLVTSKAD